MKDNLECKICNNFMIYMIKKQVYLFIHNNNITLTKNIMMKIKMMLTKMFQMFNN